MHDIERLRTLSLASATEIDRAVRGRPSDLTPVDEMIALLQALDVGEALLVARSIDEQPRWVSDIPSMLLRAGERIGRLDQAALRICLDLHSECSAALGSRYGGDRLGLAA